MKNRIWSVFNPLFTSVLLASGFLLVLLHAPVAHTQSAATTDQQSQEVARVLRVSIVCRDIESTTRIWSEIFSLPMPQIATNSPSSFMDYQSTTPHAEFKRALLQLENTQIEFLQPVGKVNSPEADFVKAYPAGVRRVLFALADSNAPERLKKLGLTKRTRGGRELYVENPARFGVVTEWTAVKENESLDSLFSENEPKARTLRPAPNGGMRSMMQVALAANDMKAMSQRWSELLGVPAPQVPTTGSGNWIFRGQPSSAQIIPVFIPFGSTEIEIIGVGSGEGTNSFKEFLNHRGGDGVQHLAFSVDDMDATVKHFEEFGMGVGLMRPPEESSRSGVNLRMMDALDKLGIDVEIFHRMACCTNGRLRSLDQPARP